MSLEFLLFDQQTQSGRDLIGRDFSGRNPERTYILNLKPIRNLTCAGDRSSLFVHETSFASCFQKKKGSELFFMYLLYFKILGTMFVYSLVSNIGFSVVVSPFS